MKIQILIANTPYWVDLGSGHSIGIPLDFDGGQPSHFGVGPAWRSTLESDGFVGDTSRGGSCNVDSLTLVPHCNGTHTESVGHIVNFAVPLWRILNHAFFLARLASVTPVHPDRHEEHYRPALLGNDLIITAEELEQRVGVRSPNPENLPTALILRTLPNRVEKKICTYCAERQPPFFSVEAMEWINRSGFQHLLVDFPSVDRMHDEGRLTNHHLFWNVVEGTHEMTDEVFINKTITEMIFVEDSLADGEYLLNLQAPGFSTDAAPSRPILYRLHAGN